MPDVSSAAPAEVTTWVAIDQHKLSLVASTLSVAGGQPEVVRLENTERLYRRGCETSCGRVMICAAPGPRPGIEWSSSSFATGTSTGKATATSSCLRRRAKPTGVWQAATATDASTTSIGVSGRCRSDAARLPSSVQASRHRRPSTRQAALPLGTARLRFGEDRPPRSRGIGRHVAPANAQIESNNEQSQGSYRPSRQLRRQIASGEL